MAKSLAFIKIINLLNEFEFHQYVRFNNKWYFIFFYVILCIKNYHLFDFIHIP